MVYLGRHRTLTTPLILAGAAVGLGILIYFFANFREERAVQRCFEAMQKGDLAAAYQIWGPTEAVHLQGLPARLGRRWVLRAGPLLPDRRIRVAGQRRDRQGANQDRRRANSEYPSPFGSSARTAPSALRPRISSDGILILSPVRRSPGLQETESQRAGTAWSAPVAASYSFWTPRSPPGPSSPSRARSRC